MPTYDYSCTECNSEFEIEHSIKEPARETCPRCGKRSLKRDVSLGSFQLKGDGWARDLYSKPKTGG